MTTLEFKCAMLKQDLKSKTEKLKYQKKIIETILQRSKESL